MTVVRDALVAFTVVSFVYFVVLNGAYLTLTALAWTRMTGDARRRRSLGLDDIMRSPLTPGITVLVPAYNEQAGIVESVRSLLALRYPRHEIIVTNDGSSDRTLAVLSEAFALRPVRVAARAAIETATVRGTYVSSRHHNLVVVDKENRGRSDAVNAGLNRARYPYVCVIDADSLLEEDALLKVAKPILDDPELLAATGGTVRVANSCRVEHGRVLDVRLPESRLATIQVLEYLRAFLVARVGWSRLNAVGIISGAFGLFHRSLLETVGGYSTTTVGEDFEITLRLHHYLRQRGEPYRIAFISDPVCWTEVPEHLRTLGRQRRRWQRGLWEGLHRHRTMLANRRYGTVGLLAMPYFAVFEFLSPIFALTGLVVTVLLWLAGGVGTAYLVAFLLASVGLGVLLTTAALLLEACSYHRYERPRDIGRLLAYTVIESVGYHQLQDIWRAIAYVDIARRRTGWGQQQRRGFAASPPEAGTEPATSAASELT